MNETSNPYPDILKRRRLCPENGIGTSPSAINMTHPPEQSQQRLASYALSVHHHPIPIDSSSSSGHKVSSGECDGINMTSSTVATHTVHQSFNNSIQATQRAVLHSEEPIGQEGIRPTKSSNAIPSRTRLSTPADPERYQGQEHVYQVNIEVENLMGTDEQGQPHLRPSVDGVQLNGMCSALEAERCTYKYNGQTDNLRGEACGPPYFSTYDNASNPFVSAAPGPDNDTQYTTAADFLPTFDEPDGLLADAAPNPDNDTQYTTAADFLPTFNEPDGLLADAAPNPDNDTQYTTATDFLPTFDEPDGLADAAPNPDNDTQYTTATDFLPTFDEPDGLADAAPNPDNDTQYTTAADFLPTFEDPDGLFTNEASQYSF